MLKRPGLCAVAPRPKDFAGGKKLDGNRHNDGCHTTQFRHTALDATGKDKP
jgi:hypothetical protein